MDRELTERLNVANKEHAASALLAVARLMREQAQAATRTGWQAGAPSWAGANAVLTDEGHPITVCGDGESAAADARHIASIANPVVALELADWLEDCAARHRRGQVVAVSAHAVAVARAYLAVHVQD
jgi:hypothetical protein